MWVGHVVGSDKSAETQRHWLETGSTSLLPTFVGVARNELSGLSLSAYKSSSSLATERVTKSSDARSPYCGVLFDLCNWGFVF